MNVLVASSSYYRQGCYRDLLEGMNHAVRVAQGGIACLAELRRRLPDLLLLEAPLLWGGSDGVLAVLQENASAPRVPIIVVCASQGNHDWFQLSRFRVDDFLVRFPTAGELRAAIDRCGAGPLRGIPAPGYRSVSAALSTPNSSLGASSCTPFPSAKY